MGKSLLHRKESVIITAVEIIDELGLQGLSTREIARRQEISEGTLFKHFKSKGEILLAVLDHYSQYDADIFHSIMFKELDPKEAILNYVGAYMEYYENYPAITSIVQNYDFLNHDPVLEEKIQEIFATKNQYSINLIEIALQKRNLPAQVSSESLNDIINGYTRFMGLKWRLNNKSFPLKEETLETLRQILDAFIPDCNIKEGR